jgi:ABC-2 type transport system ATP-binding protein
VLVVDHVRKGFGSVTAVRDVSFTIPDRATFGLLGPNGAGKTTTMRMILGILVPDGGTISWNGRPVGPAMRRVFGYLPEERGLYGRMKVRDQIAYFGRLHGIGSRTVETRVDRWLERLELTPYAGRPCAELSKGNQQKVQVACAAVHEPELLVLDEPFSGLDPVNAEMLFSVLNELRAAGTTLVLSSHQMWQLEHLCDRFCIIAAGENRAAGTLTELRSAWPTRVVRVAPSSEAVRNTLSVVPGARLVGENGESLEYELPSTTAFADVLRNLVATNAITRFDTLDPSLQDVYLNAIANGKVTQA